MIHYDSDCAYGIRIAYIGGGSRGWAWKLMADLALEGALHGEIRLYDVDFARAKRNAVIGNRVSERADALGKWRYQAVQTLDEALLGADFVIASVLPGTFDEMESDVHAPEAYGVWQSVGDTTGPGGIVRALRTMPIYTHLAERIRAVCPGAFVINYTNPMTLCTRILYETFPGIRAFGCCHEIFGTQRLLANIYMLATGETGIDRSQIKVNVLGVNHFTWIDRAYYRNTDLFPIYAAFVEQHYAEGVAGLEKDHWLNQYFQSMQRVKFDLFRRYGLIAAAGDRHLAEFMPEWYLRSREQAEQEWKFSLTPVSWRKERAEDLLQKSIRLECGEEAVALKPSGEEGVAQMKALLGLAPLVTNVNLPNAGQMPQLPAGAVVETNASFTAGQLSPVLAGSLPEPVLSLVARHAYTQEAVVKGYATQDREAIYRAFALDPQLRGLTERESRALFARMLENTAAYLPVFLQ